MAKASLVGILCDCPHLSHRKGLNLVKFIKTVIFIVVFFKLCEQVEVTGSKLWQVGRVWEQWRIVPHEKCGLGDRPVGRSIVRSRIQFAGTPLLKLSG